jgi:lipopolysaccharide transport system ATP-binding protein
MREPTVFHATHYKAGSQWIHRILHWCAPERIVPPRAGNAHLLNDPLQPGMIYPTLYITKEQLESVKLPPNSHVFVVIRNLRDTLVSLYFSFLSSHTVTDPGVLETRASLQRMSRTDGLLWLMRHSAFLTNAEIQHSWIAAGTPIIRYEELLVHDETILEKVLLHHCELPVSREHLQNAVRGCRFEALTGRKPGQEDPSSHARKGIVGDWRNYFDDTLVRAFVSLYGDVEAMTQPS